MSSQISDNFHCLKNTVEEGKNEIKGWMRIVNIKFKFNVYYFLSVILR